MHAVPVEALDRAMRISWDPWRSCSPAGRTDPPSLNSASMQGACLLACGPNSAKAVLCGSLLVGR